LFEGGEGREETGLLRGLAEDPGAEATWGVYSDWLQDRGEQPAGAVVLRRALAAASRGPVARLCNSLPTPGLGTASIPQARAEMAGLETQLKQAGTHDPAKSLVQVSDHVAQMCVHTATWGKRDLYHRWVFFDDLWASANPALAEAVLRHAA